MAHSCYSCNKLVASIRISLRYFLVLRQFYLQNELLARYVIASHLSEGTLIKITAIDGINPLRTTLCVSISSALLVANDDTNIYLILWLYSSNHTFCNAPILWLEQINSYHQFHLRKCYLISCFKFTCSILTAEVSSLHDQTTHFLLTLMVWRQVTSIKGKLASLIDALLILLVPLGQWLIL
jgi:hypothetical protein